MYVSVCNQLGYNNIILPIDQNRLHQPGIYRLPYEACFRRAVTGVNMSTKYLRVCLFCLWPISS